MYEQSEEHRLGDHAVRNHSVIECRLGFSAHPANAGGAEQSGCMGWVPDLLPNLEQKPIYDRIQRSFSGQLATLNGNRTCSESMGTWRFSIARVVRRRIAPAPNSYVGQCGDVRLLQQAGSQLDYQANGVFFDTTRSDYPVKYPSQVNMDRQLRRICRTFRTTMARPIRCCFPRTSTPPTGSAPISSRP